MNKVSLCIRAEGRGHSAGVAEGAGQGIHIITNGWVLSAQAGWGNYHSCDPSRHPGMILERDTVRPDCEIALWPHPDGDMINLGSDNVIGWMPWAAVFEIACWLMHLDHVPDGEEVRATVLANEKAAKE